jgi:hypothetical protein
VVEDGRRVMLRIKALYRARGIKTPSVGIAFSHPWQTLKSKCTPRVPARYP